MQIAYFSKDGSPCGLHQHPLDPPLPVVTLDLLDEPIPMSLDTSVLHDDVASNDHLRPNPTEPMVAGPKGTTAQKQQRRLPPGGKKRAHR